MSGREPGRSPDDGLEAVQLELDANNQALAKLEHALERDSRNPYLLKKYERLSKREELLLEERKLWAGELPITGHSSTWSPSYSVVMHQIVL